LLEAESAAAVADGNGPEGGQQRINDARQLRFDAARQMASVGIPDQLSNGDEQLYPNKIGNYSKGLRHNAIGEVDPGAYAALISAIDSGKFADFEALATNGHLGSGDPTRQRRQVSPMSGYAFDLEGLDSHQFSMRAAPAFSSPEEAGEMVELYWMSMLRDVNFLDYETHPLARLAAEDLSRLSDFRGPKQGNRVTPQTLFRDNFPGCAVGPYVSQFLLKDCPMGAQLVDQRIRTAAAGTDFMTDFQSWLDIQNGIQPTQKVQLDEPRFCRNGRDIGQYVHVDALYQAYLVAGLVLFANGMPWDRNNPYGQTPEPGSGLPLPPGVPGSLAQVGFSTFGGPHLLALLTEVSTRAAKAQWFQKWLVHRRLRPEEFGGRVEVVRSNLAQYPIHSDLFRSQALDQLLSKFGSHLLPMAFPEGSPLHTSYGSGHSTVAGACITVLKAWFDESAIIPKPVVPNSDGSGLIPYEGPELTVGGELNKIASNIAQGRNMAGVHWRSDATEAIKLGEAVAISVLRDQKPTYREPFQGFTLTKLDGTLITI
jgi:membrane-associated phospholipid phosphatase